MLNKTICELDGILFHHLNQENSVVVHYILVASYVLFVIFMDKTLHMNSYCCCMSWVSRGVISELWAVHHDNIAMCRHIFYASKPPKTMRRRFTRAYNCLCRVCQDNPSELQWIQNNRQATFQIQAEGRAWLTWLFVCTLCFVCLPAGWNKRYVWVLNIRLKK